MARHNKVGTHATKVVDTENSLTVTYHDTDVVAVDKNKKTVTLDTGGYYSVTTKARMNQASNEYDLGFDVYQRNYVFYVDTPNGDTLEFGDNDQVTFSLN